MTSNTNNDLLVLDNELTDSVKSRVKAELDAGERLLWTGRPVAVKDHPLLIPGIVLLATLMAAGVILMFAATPFIVLSIYSGPILVIILLSVWLERRRRAGTFYALTDRRAIIWQPLSLRPSAIRVQTLGRGEVASVSRVEYDDGSGDVQFRVKGVELGHRGHTEPASFRGVTEVRRVEEQARRILMGPASGEVRVNA